MQAGIRIRHAKKADLAACQRLGAIPELSWGDGEVMDASSYSTRVATP